MREEGNGRYLAILAVLLTTLVLMAFFTFFKIYAFLPLLLAILLISIIRNPIFGFFIALFVSCIVFKDLDYFFIVVLEQIDYEVLAILTVGGVFGVLLAGDGSFDFYIWLRRKAKTFKIKKGLAALVALFNFFSSTTSVVATNLLLHDDFKNEIINEEDKKDLLRIVLMLCNAACVLVPFSLWWLFFIEFEEDVHFSFASIYPFLFYPMVVISYIFLNIVVKEGKNEYPLEKRTFDPKRLIFLVILPTSVTYIILFTEGFHIWLYNVGLLNLVPFFKEKTLIFGSFILGTVATFFIYVLYNAFSIRTDANLKKAMELIDEGRKIINASVNEIESGEKGFIAEDKNLNPVLFKRIHTQLSVDDYTKDLLKKSKSFYRIDHVGSFPRLRTSFTSLTRNLFDGVSRFSNLFIEGMKKKLGSALIFISILGIEELTLGLGVEIPELNLLADIQPLLPVFIFLLAALIGYPIGTAWGTFAIGFMLFIIPLNGLISPATLSLAIAALISAGMFVNQVSSFAENVIFTSSVTGFSPEYITKSIKGDALRCFLITTVLYALFGVVSLILGTHPSLTIIPIVLSAVIVLTFSLNLCERYYGKKNCNGNRN